jgi:hypothetical protein
MMPKPASVFVSKQSHGTTSKKMSLKRSLFSVVAPPSQMAVNLKYPELFARCSGSFT